LGISKNEEAWATLEQICLTDSVAVIKPELLKMSMDKSGATFAHYGAAVLSEQKFEGLIVAAPEQMKAVDQLGQLPVHAAANAGHAAVVEKLIVRDASQLEAKTKSGATPLIYAIQQGKKDVVEKLLLLGANPNYRLPNGLFPLFLAIQGNYPDLALSLLNGPTVINLNETIDNGMTALHLAIENGLEQVALRLIEKDAALDSKRKTDGFTPYHLAVQKGKLALIVIMLKKGISLGLVLESKKTALHIAAESGQLEIVLFLISQGLSADIKTLDGETPLMLAIKAGHTEVAKALALSTSTLINTVNANHQTVSLLAQLHHMPTISDILIKAGENPALKDNQGRDYIYQIVSAGDHQRFKLLMRKNAIDMNQCYEGESLLAIAARNGHFLLVSELLEQKAEYKTQQGLQLIHYAILSDEIGFLREWLEATKTVACSIQSRSHKGKSLAYLAAENKSRRCFNLLIKKLSRDDIETQNLMTAAIAGGDINIVAIILRKCEDINQALDRQGNTALHLAVGYGAIQLLNLLKDSGCNFALPNKRKETAFHIAVMQEDVQGLKHLFKLTTPSEWPHDLWKIPNDRLTSSIIKVLDRFKKRLPVLSTLLSEAETKENTQPIETFTEISSLKIQDISALETLIKEEAFDEAAELLEQNPALINAFKSSQGGELLKLIFKHIYDYSFLTEATKENAAEELIEATLLQLSKPDRLFTILKKANINPAVFKGKDNVLLAIIHSENEDIALYRLAVLANFFSESVSQLAQDHYSPKVRIVELALKLNRVKLFEKLDEICPTTADISHPLPFYSLHEAVLSGNYELVQRLLKRYPVDSLNNKNQTPLMLAACNDDVRMLELLIHQGAWPDKVDIYGRNVLHHALMRKSENAALFLLPKLRHKNAPDRHGMRPLAMAAQQGLLSVVSCFCNDEDHTQEVNKQGHNALHTAAIFGQTEIIIYLVKQGFPVDKATEKTGSGFEKKPCLKRTALHFAALKGHVDAVSALLTLGANPSQEDAMGNTINEFAVMSKNSDMLRAIQQLPAYHDKEHDIRLLHAAAMVNNVEVLSELILDEINLNAVNASGFAALHIAALNDAGDFARLLMQGDDIVVDMGDYEGNTALHHAANKGHVRILEILAKAHASINALNREKVSPLFIACSSGHIGAVTTLLKYQADFTLPNQQGITPAQIALLNGHIEIAHQLICAGDKSLQPDCITQLPHEIKEKITILYKLSVSRLTSKDKQTIGHALVQRGIFRCKKIPTEPEDTTHITKPVKTNLQVFA
jgi:ankyrin repeat protein